MSWFQRGLDDQQITFVLAMDGLCCFLSRILVGALGHDDKVDKLVVYFGLYLIASFVQVHSFPSPSLSVLSLLSSLSMSS